MNVKTRPLEYKRHWIFDLDGTLTVAQHDFDAIRAQLKLPPGKPILEALDRLPEAEAESKARQLAVIEEEIADRAREQTGAGELLENLRQNRINAGILTRNSLLNAKRTLQACGLEGFFSDGDIVSRGCAPPKPSPDGIHTLLGRWRGKRKYTVMVGDYLFDMQCGKLAGVETVYFDPGQEGLWNSHADHVVVSMGELASLA